MDGSSLYETDVVAWSEEQVAKLRALAATAGSNAVDWENVIEEIESVGRSQRSKAESLVKNALVHLIKVASSPQSLSARSWRDEVTMFLDQADDALNPSLRASLDLDFLWSRACESARANLAPYGESLSTRVPVACPFTLHHLLRHRRDVDVLLEALS